MFRTACTHHQLPELLITFHAAFFCDPIVCYLGSLAVISETHIFQWMWFCPPDRLPAIRVIISYLKTNSLP